MEDIFSNRNKILGMLYGVAIGDALGAPFEFFKTEPKQTYDGILKDESVTIHFRFSSTELKPASITDDTEMTLELLSSIIEKKTYDVNNVILHYLDWAQRSKFLGRNTRALMKGVKTIKGYEKRKTQIDMKNAQSNGSLMRASPLALLKDWKTATVQDTSITNENTTNIECSLIYISLLRQLLFGYRFECSITDKNINDVLKKAVDGEIIDVGGKTKGWVVYALYVVFITFFNTQSYEDAMDYIMKNFGNRTDTDTIMAITGAVMGAYIGFEDMMKEKKTKINIKKLNRYFELSKIYDIKNIIK